MKKATNRNEKSTQGPVILKNGFIVDGTGDQGYTGNLLIRGDIIEKISRREIKVDARVIDCSGRVISPGFIDIHSHNDWFMNSKSEFRTPFTEQGITTFVGGNCGYSAAGFSENSPYRDLLEDNLFKAGHRGLRWDTFEDYFSNISKNGMSHNLATLAGHGTTRTSIRGYDPSPMKGDSRKELLYLLEKSMDHGAKGVSFGLGYAPDIFTTRDEIKEVANLVKKRDGIITVHVRAFSSISGVYPLKPFGTPHNILALQEMIDLARDTGVKLQISHLIIVGERSWKTLDRVINLINSAAAQGLDIRFDTYAYHCGASVITGILPDWFMAKVPHSYNDRALLRRLRILMNISFGLLGFNTSDIQIAAANYPELNRFNGMFLKDIARERKLSDFENYVDFAQKSNSTARVLMYKYSNEKIVEELIRHPLSHFMTDAWVEPEGVQNPSAFGCFPRFLQIAREKKIISLEETVHKMTLANAERMKIKDRGVLKKGKAADIVIFDYNNVRDNTSKEKSDAKPGGIETVFINGEIAMQNGKVNKKVKAGRVLT